MLNRRDFVKNASLLGLGCGFAGCRCLVPPVQLFYSTTVERRKHLAEGPRCGN